MAALAQPGQSDLKAYGLTPAQLAVAPEAQLLLDSQRWIFFDVTAPKNKYAIDTLNNVFVPVGGAVTILIDSNRVVTSANQSLYNGAVWEFTGAFSVTLSAGLPNDFGAIFIPPVAGSAAIVSDGTVLLNGATATVTKTAAAAVVFALTQRASNRNSYVL